MLQPLVRRTWAKCGKTPILKAWDRHDRLTVISALVWEPHLRKDYRLYFQVKRRNANADAFFYFLVELHRELNNRLIVIWDRLGAHRKAAKVFHKLEIPWIAFEYLPAYCPELNPVEHVWSTTKYGCLANWPAPDVDTLHDRVETELSLQSKNRAMLSNHFRWARLGTDTLLC